MDKNLQQFILNFLRTRTKGNKALKEDVHDEVVTTYPDMSDSITKGHIYHQLDLLLQEGLISSKDTGHGFVFYSLTPAGHRYFDGTGKKALHFVLFDNRHNLYSIISVLISLLALSISIIAFIK